MANIFSSKTVFKEQYVKQVKDTFQVDLCEATTYQKYYVLANLLNDEQKHHYDKTQKYIQENNLKKTIYFSMEFLMGRLITNNLHNSGYYHVVKDAFDDLGLDINEIELKEVDAGLGNGGLGRLGACFLDSAASLGLPLYGNSLRYQYGFFAQKFVNNKQVEQADNWLSNPFIWEERKEDEAIHIPYFGYVEHTKLKNPVWIKAVPYDVMVVGNQNGVVNHLRLWTTEKSELHLHQDENYLKMVSNITRVLYPDDSKESGKTIRLQQQYLFSAAGIKSAINDLKKRGLDLHELPQYYSFQINDTHPTLIIPELMRILMDEENFPYDIAWDITTKVCAFTNHTILSEALEKWDIRIFRNLLPRIYEIIQEMNRRFKVELISKNLNERQIYQLQLIGSNSVRMANISLLASYSVNGVARLHTDILKHIEMKDWYQLFPNKFNNKTNGITPRRWLIHSNRELTEIINDLIGTAWQFDLDKIIDLARYKDDLKVQKRIEKMKKIKKQALANRIYRESGIALDVNSIFDIQVKRLHEYKRQLLNILHIIYVYNRLKEDAVFKKNYYPHTFIFGAKAAPSYHMAKAIIELINASAAHINQDQETNHLLKVVFVENYNATYAEYIMPACDLSEQISTASKEASGTGNMKFMLNGAITIGTMDGANVEIVENVGAENAIIFGLSADEVNQLHRENHYQPQVIYNQDVRLQKVFTFIRNLQDNPQHFDYVLSNLLNSDYYLVLKDFDSYVQAHEKANELYQDRQQWLAKSILNIAHAGFFSSDRTIKQYNDEIWHLTPVITKE